MDAQSYLRSSPLMTAKQTPEQLSVLCPQIRNCIRNHSLASWGNNQRPHLTEGSGLVLCQSLLRDLCPPWVPPSCTAQHSRDAPTSPLTSLGVSEVTHPGMLPWHPLCWVDPDPPLAIPGAECGTALAPPSPSVPRLMRLLAKTYLRSPSSSQRGSGSVLSFFFPFPPLVGGHTLLLHNQQPALGRARKPDIHITCQTLSSRDY